MMSFRDLQISDLGSVKELISEAWYKKVFGMMSEEDAERAFRFYIGHYLIPCTFAEVCEMDGEFAGVLIGRGNNEERKYPEEKFPSMDEIPWIMRHLLKKIYNNNSKMLSACSGRGLDSELELYITDDRFRGKGVGTALLERFMEHLKETGHRRMYLFTDDFCSVDYYIKRGFKEEISRKLFTDFRFHKFMILSIELQ